MARPDIDPGKPRFFDTTDLTGSAPYEIQAYVRGLEEDKRVMTGVQRGMDPTGKIPGVYVYSAPMSETAEKDPRDPLINFLPPAESST